MKITGFVETFITDKNGVKRKVGSHHNTIVPGATGFFEALARNLAVGIDFTLDNLFTVAGTPPSQGKDGIYLHLLYGGTTYDFMSITTLSQPSSNKLRATGVYTNATGGTVVATGAYLGKYYSTFYETFTDFWIATGSPGWVNKTLPNGEIFTVVWTITFTVH